MIWNYPPSLVILALLMLNQVVFALKPLCAFDTIPLTLAWQVLYSFRRFVLCKVSGRFEVGVDKIKISSLI